MRTHTFTINTGMAVQPLLVSDAALEDFRNQSLSVMEECLERLRTSLPASPTQRRDQLSHKALVGHLLLDGFATGNTRKMILCALWMAHNHPEITGLVSTGEGFEFIYGDDARSTGASTPRCAEYRP